MVATPPHNFHSRYVAVSKAISSDKNYGVVICIEESWISGFHDLGLGYRFQGSNSTVLLAPLALDILVSPLRESFRSCRSW